MTEITPRTAARVANLADRNDKATDLATQRGPGAKPKKLRLLTADDELELADEDFAPPNEDDTDILGPERFIPSNPDIVRLREIVADPASHFIPTIKVGGTTMFYAGPEGLAPELQELFNFPATVLRRVRDGADEDADEHRRAKRARLEDGHPQEDDVELGRRGSAMPSEHPFDFGAGAGADDSFNFGGDFDFGAMPENDFGMPEELVTPRKRRERERERNQREASLAPSRAESIARQIQFGERDEDHPLAMFDGRPPRPDAAAQDSLGSLATPSKSSVAEEETVRATKGGYSKNTGMAMGMLRRELEAIEAESEAEAGEKKVKFGQLADKASRKAASTFFFELLVLGTRDCVKLEQKKAFGEIEIRGKDKLWEEISA
jgi:cohesin complex subunit SCC1